MDALLLSLSAKEVFRLVISMRVLHSSMVVGFKKILSAPLGTAMEKIMPSPFGLQGSGNN